MNLMVKTAASAAMVLALTGCKSEMLNSQAGMAALGGLVGAATVSEQQVVNNARLSAKQMDQQAKVAPANNPYAKRLNRLVKNLQQVDGIQLNYKVYLSKELNAFAMPDGTVRVYSGLMDILDDAELLSVIGHEIGHVKLKHSYNQYRKALLAHSARSGLVAVGGEIGALAGSDLGAVTLKYVDAQFSQSDELSADRYGVEFLRHHGHDPQAAARAFLKLKQHSGEGGGLFSSHPATSERIEQIENQIAGQ